MKSPCRIVALAFSLAAGCALAVPPMAAQGNATTYHYDSSRTGQNTGETILRPSNVNALQFGKLFSQPVDGAIYAQPLYVYGLVLPGKGTHNVVFAATEGDSVYAFDADSNAGANVGPLWRASLIDAAHGAAPGATPVDISRELACFALLPGVGITGTPVIDLPARRMYVEAFSKEQGAFVHRLHALDLATGEEQAPGPVVVEGAVPGSGAGSAGGRLAFDPLRQLNRAGLLLLDGTVYVAYGSHCDKPPNHGWLFAYNAAALAQKGAFVTTPDGRQGGIWMSGAGLAADSEGNLFLSTGDGDFDAEKVPAAELSNSILKIGWRGGKLAVLDYFTPFNEAQMGRHDQDLGSGGVLLLPSQPGPHPHLLVEIGKEGTLYLIDRGPMASGGPHYCANCVADTQIVQEIRGAARHGAWSMPAYWNGAIYLAGSDDLLRAFTLRNGVLSAAPQEASPKTASPEASPGVFPGVSKEAFGYPGSGLSISANGAAQGIVWALDTHAYEVHGPAVLKAYDAGNLSRMLYASDQDKNRDNPGGAVKFTVPTVVNGKVYVGAAGQLSVYGLLKNHTP